MDYYAAQRAIDRKRAALVRLVGRKLRQRGQYFYGFGPGERDPHKIVEECLARLRGQSAPEAALPSNVIRFPGP